ncbi:MULTISPECIES: FAD-dependent monooxygenase [unclassified Mesorhizobium]|uniref:FAD-dependent monooxygenase n=1 Tax=unclassified Mesorhizobium TaxID=325217 RepID=UPI0015E48ABB
MRPKPDVLGGLFLKNFCRKIFETQRIWFGWIENLRRRAALCRLFRRGRVLCVGDAVHNDCQKQGQQKSHCPRRSVDCVCSLYVLDV